MMKGFSARKPIVMEGSWNGAGVVLQAEDAGELEARIRNLLFAWHEPSWYGSEIEYLEVDGPSKIRPMLLSPLIALDYLSSPQPVRMLSIEWGQSAKELQAGAARILEALTEGHFEPDWTGWKGRERRWRFQDTPDSGHKNEASGEWLLQWLSACVEDLITEDDTVRAAWSSLERSIGPALERRSPDEEDWYIGIGLKQDSFPFRIALQLAEPDESGDWTLRAALRGRSGEDGWIPLDRGDRSGSWRPASGSVLRLPEEWLPLLEERLQREERKWSQALPEWIEPEGETVKRKLDDEEAWLFLEQASLKLLDAGATVLLPGWWENVRKRRVRLKAKLKSAAGSADQPMFGLSQIVQFDWKLALGGADLSEEEFMKLAAQNKRLMKIDGEWIHLHPEDITRIRGWIKKNGGRKGLSFRDIMQMHLQGGIALSEDEEIGEELLKVEVELNSHLQQLMNQLQDTTELPLVEVPSSFRGELRPYQHQGVSWLTFLRRFGLGATLADDMGLGKTIQFTAYLLHIKETGGEGDPSLLICPTSVIGNWEKELQRFAPGLDVRLHYGPRRVRGRDAFVEFAKGADLVITSYALASLDEEELGAFQWESLCLDEAQNIKNVYTKQSSAIRNLRSGHRIALTGTPMENRLSELWSIYDFTNPGYLGSLPEFRRAVILPIEKERNLEMIGSLQRRIKPFMLRRLKKDPAIQLSLPEKNEGQVYVTLTAEQGALYEGIVSDLLEKLDTLAPMQRRGLILASITRLKQVCDHPALLLGEEQDSGLWTPDRSAKLMRLLEMCEEIAAEGERALIFTQFVDMGLALQRILKERLGLPVPYLHGGVPKAKRDDMIAAFQDPEQPHGAFVLSLKAGGIGLNLTEANHVFHFDRWWNPAVENQATDRAFRIGQTRQVQVHKFVALGTLEERIHEMIERKQSLNDQVVSQSEQWITELSTDELREIFTLRRDWLEG
ncbi:Superfamily II DNA or RNA helicase, SNF2 family [Paenibacillaceae bacterium GAS479]|nr:Superfamily II DNA or RNA helicase, SNF2 family [Paenibacillaceae bacterium GAS479]